MAFVVLKREDFRRSSEFFFVIWPDTYFAIPACCCDIWQFIFLILADVNSTSNLTVVNVLHNR